MYAAAVRNVVPEDVATTLLNVAVIPPRPIVDLAAEMSRDLARRGGLFQLDNRSRYAHLTLYMARFETALLSEVSARAQEIARNIRPFRVMHSGYHVSASNYHEISYERNDVILHAHEKMTRPLCEHRFSPESPVVEDYFGEYSAAQRANVRAVGYDLAGALYRPHVTITRVKEGVTAEPPAVHADLSFVATTLGLFEADRFGAARRLIDSFELA